MTRLILTGESGVDLMRSDLADVAIVFCFRFVWGPLPSPDELATYLAARSDQHPPGTHWSDFGGRWHRANKGCKDLGLVEFCQQYETVELWFDPGPNDQLQLIWLLDYFRSHPETATSWEIGSLLERLAHGPRPAVAGLDEELRTLDRENLRDRHTAYLRSELSLTEFGKAVLGHKEDFTRHNPIDRWWGGTHLTNDRLWRWNPPLVKP
jgi:hypothetical protein